MRKFLCSQTQSFPSHSHTTFDQYLYSRIIRLFPSFPLVINILCLLVLNIVYLLAVILTGFFFPTFIQTKLFPQAVSYLEKTFQVRRPAGTILLSRYVTLHTGHFLQLFSIQYSAHPILSVWQIVSFILEYFIMLVPGDQTVRYLKRIKEHLLGNHSFPDFPL